tara:strand:+ start:190 stop:1284 length:1095 start_codon:yes stop_codon:yes gene_type:complete
LKTNFDLTSTQPHKLKLSAAANPEANNGATKSTNAAVPTTMFSSGADQVATLSEAKAATAAATEATSAAPEYYGGCKWDASKKGWIITRIHRTASELWVAGRSSDVHGPRPRRCEKVTELYTSEIKQWLDELDDKRSMDSANRPDHHYLKKGSLKCLSQDYASALLRQLNIEQTWDVGLPNLIRQVDSAHTPAGSAAASASFAAPASSAAAARDAAAAAAQAEEWVKRLHQKCTEFTRKHGSSYRPLTYFRLWLYAHRHGVIKFRHKVKKGGASGATRKRKRGADQKTDQDAANAAVAAANAAVAAAAAKVDAVAAAAAEVAAAAAEVAAAAVASAAAAARAAAAADSLAAAVKAAAAENAAKG